MRPVRVPVCLDLHAVSAADEAGRHDIRGVDPGGVVHCTGACLELAVSSAARLAYVPRELADRDRARGRTHHAPRHLQALQCLFWDFFHRLRGEPHSVGAGAALPRLAVSARLAGHLHLDDGV